MLRVTLPRAALSGLSPVKGKAGVKVAVFAEPKPAIRSSPGWLVVRVALLGLVELPSAVRALSRRLLEAMPGKSAALIRRGGERGGGEGAGGLLARFGAGG